MECNICGKDTPKLFKVKVEETIVEVCERCLKYGEKVVEPEEVRIPPKRVRIVTPLPEEETVFVENYGKLIVEARGRMNLTREEFAEKIKEKESVIRRIENEEMMPDDALTKKIEKFLGIKLRKPYEKRPMRKREKKGELTLGDVVEVR